jgi:NAD(P)-dependent dehydrogenase (short-subunit alcohol dehydrogenase family)
MDLALTSVHVLITGAAGGIGITTVREFLAHGAVVTAQYRSTRAALDEAFPQEIKQGKVQCVAADVTREEDVARLFVDAEKGMGKPVSVLIGTCFSLPTLLR